MHFSHVHIVLNNFPTIGTLLGVVLYVYALWKKNQDLQIVSFITFLVLAMIAIPTVITGAAADLAVS